MPFDGNQVLNRDQEIVQGAQECLAKNGWARGTLRTAKGEHCIMGAILEVAGVPLTDERFLPVNSGIVSGRLDDALLQEAMARGMERFPTTQYAGWNTAVGWNNCRAKDAAEVIDFLECVKERLADGA